MMDAVDPKNLSVRRAAQEPLAAPQTGRSRLMSRWRTLHPFRRLAPSAESHGTSPLLASFIVLVIMPTIAACVYFGVLASDQFTVEARFAVRGVEDDAPRSPEARRTREAAWGNAEIIASYIRSTALVEVLAARLDLATLLAPPGADMLARLPHDATREVRDAVWRRMVSATIDHTSGILTLKVRAFRPADALSLARSILQASDELAETLSIRLRRDRLVRAEADLRLAETHVHATLDELTRFRDALGLIDPVKAAADVGRLLVQVLGDRLRLERLQQVGRQATPEGPALSTLDTQIAAADSQIAGLRSQLAGTGGKGDNLAAALARFEDIDLRRQLAERLYTAARETYEQARHASMRRDVYLTVFIAPSLPEAATYPRRIAFSVVAATIFLLAWGIFALTVASVRDHRR